MARIDDQDHPLRPLVSGWIGKLEKARESKSDFQDVADECMQFYHSTSDFMWQPNYKFKFWDTDEGGAPSPRFRMQVNKAFELVALFAPVLYHKNPHRLVTPREAMEIPPDLFGPANPMAMQMYQMAMMEQQAQAVQDKMRAELMSRYLNYTPNELNLQQNAEFAVTEALIKGASTLWSEPHQPDGSDKLIVGSFHDSIDNLLIDPDAEKLEEAHWIAKCCIHPIWKVEREYKLPKGSLGGKGNFESATVQGELKGNQDADIMRKRGDTADLLVYWKIWSKMGCGARLSGVKSDLADAMDETFGDHCYLVVARDVPYPLNMPTDWLLSSTDDELSRAAEWPVPYWTDNRWPVSIISFYHKPRELWPIAPLAPGLGELKFINTMMSHLANRIWTSCRDFIAIAKSAGDELRTKIMHGKDQTFIDVETAMGKIDEVVQFLQQPETRLDVWKILEAVMDMFDKRTGLTELVYGMTARQIRTASEVQAKKEQISVRPDYMAARVDNWMTEAARKEGFCARWYLTGEDVAPLLGQTAGMLWDQLVLSQDVNKVVQEMEFRVESGSSKKINLEQRLADAEQALQYFGPIFDAHANITGNVGPMNELVRQWGLYAQMPTRDMMMETRIDPMKAMQLQQQQMMMQQQQAAMEQGQMPPQGPPPEAGGGPPPEQPATIPMGGMA